MAKHTIISASGRIFLIPLVIRCLSYAGALLCFILYPNAAGAGNLKLEPRLELRGIYSDNVDLKPGPGASEEIIAIVTPGLTIHHDREAVDLDLDYSLQNIIYGNGTADTKHNHLLQVDNRNILVRELLFLDMSARNRQQNISSSGSPASDAISVTDNVSNVFTYRINPHLNYGISNLALVEAAYEKSEVLVDSNRTIPSNDNSDANRYSLSIKNGSRFDRLLWDAEFFHEDISYENTDSITFQKINFGIDYVLNRQLTITADLGHENNDFPLSSQDTGGAFWKAGLIYTPNSRTYVLASGGHRFFGYDLQLLLNHQSRKTSTRVDVQRTATTTRSYLTQQQLFDLLDPSGIETPDPAAILPPNLIPGIPDQTAEILVLTQVSGVFSYQLKKNRFNLQAQYHHRKYQSTGNTEGTFSTGFSWDWFLSTKFDTSLDIGYDTYSLRTGIEDELYKIECRMRYALSNKLILDAGYRWYENHSNIPIRNFTENRLYIGLNKTF